MTIATRRTALLAFASTAVAVPVLLQARAAFAQADGNEYKTQTLALGTVALQTSQVAVEKAQDPMVKEFAQLEVAEQQTIAEILGAAGAEPPALPEDQAAMVQQMQDMEAGAEFDRAYVEAQIAGHQQLLEVQQTMADGSELSVEVVTAKLAEQAITSHLAMLNHIQQQLQS